ncbi:MAG TPA: hypothetical protein VMM36_17810 [Opitutaceae bacterium]|nr:hypothetical protein [Opitutaceae bacterium]
MQTVFILWHAYETSENQEESKLIGVYESRDAAERAKQRARKLPGFVGNPDAFVVDEYEIGKDHWTDGFVNVGHLK